MNYPIDGLTFERKENGSLVLDYRNKEKIKYVGIIVKRPFSSGYMLCPFLQKGLLFDRQVPKKFKTIERAERWVALYAVKWNNRTYTPFNPLIGNVLSNDVPNSTIVRLRLQNMFTQLSLATVLIWLSSSNSDMNTIGQITTYVIATGFGILGIANIIATIKDFI